MIASALDVASSSLQHGNTSSSSVCHVLLQFFLKRVEASEEYVAQLYSVMLHTCRVTLNVHSSTVLLKNYDFYEKQYLLIYSLSCCDLSSCFMLVFLSVL